MNWHLTLLSLFFSLVLDKMWKSLCCSARSKDDQWHANKVVSDDLHVKTGVHLAHNSKKGFTVDLLLCYISVFSEGPKQENSLSHSSFRWFGSNALDTWHLFENRLMLKWIGMELCFWNTENKSPFSFCLGTLIQTLHWVFNNNLQVEIMLSGRLLFRIV